MSQKRILLVDDEPDFLYLSSICLREAGYEVELAENGRICLEKTPLFRPDMILLDIRMPGMDGWKVCEEILKLPGTQKVSIYFLTALVGREVEERATKIGAQGVLRKPMGATELLQSVRQVLG